MNIGIPAFDYQRGSVYAMNSKVLNADANYTVSLGMISEQDVVEVNTFYDKVPYNWCIYGDDQAACIVLQKSGMHKQVTVTAMGIDLGADLSDAMHDTHLQIKEVDTFSPDFTNTFEASFEIEGSDIEVFKRYILERVGPDNVRCYVAYYDEVPVSTAMYLRKDTDVALCCVATDTDYRHKGCGSAICHRILSDAKASGANAWLASSDMGYPVYKKLGFVEYGPFEVWGSRK